MERITLRIKADIAGHYTTVDILKQIKTSCKAIVFPDKTLKETCIADLCLNGKKAIKGITEGIYGTWNNEIMEYMERDFILIFDN